MNLHPLICKQREGVYQFFVLVSSVLFYSGYSQETNLRIYTQIRTIYIQEENYASKQTSLKNPLIPKVQILKNVIQTNQAKPQDSLSVLHL